MRHQQTLWESSSRPLFVRSVWIESSDGGRRHFILDYENQRKLNECVNKAKKVLRPTISYEAAETQSLPLQLIGSSKSCRPFERPKTACRRSQTLSPLHKRFVDPLKRRGSVPRDDQATSSKRSSLQDLNYHDTINCDEKLAERVLNWLDLAGKTTIIKSAPSNSMVSPANPGPSKKSSTTRRSKSCGTRTATAQSKRPDSVKHITIIFNKEGIPVRYNRPIRFSDLFRSGYSASKKFASTISSRQGKQTEILAGSASGLRRPQSHLPGSGAFERASRELNRSKSRENSAVKQNVFESDYRSLINKQLLESSCNLHEMKKQLHIFMPSLPKKTFVQADCDSSCLSTVLSDYCKISS